MSTVSRILCPTDLSNLSLEALAMAGSLARHFQAELQLLHVVPSLEIVYPLAPVYIPVPFDVAEYEQALRSAASEQLTGILQRFGLESVRAQAIVTVGSPADMIVETAEQSQGDLIVMTTHGHTGWRHLVFGSVTEQVIRLARCPVLICHSRKQPGAADETGAAEAQSIVAVRKIVCSTDFSEQSLKGVDTAIIWAKELQAELIIVHIVPSLDRYPGFVVDAEDIESSVESDASKQLYALVAHRVPEQLQSRYVVRSGKAAEEIVNVAREENADLVVTATHGRTGWDHLAFGSVAEAVIRTAHCPVLTIRSTKVEE